MLPPPFATQFAEVEVDVETGQVTVKKLVMAVDCGIAINPVTATAQVEGGMVQALGYAVSEDMVYDDAGRLQNPRALQTQGFRLRDAQDRRVSS